MKKEDFIKIAVEYMERVKNNQPFKLKNIIGEDCPTLPGRWLYEEVKNGTFNTSKYTIKCIEKDYSDTYIKKEK